MTELDSESVATQVPLISNSSQPDLNTGTQTIIAILLLLFVMPIGLIYMWIKMRGWPTWLKVIISLPLTVAIGLIIFNSILFSILPKNNVPSSNLRINQAPSGLGAGTRQMQNQAMDQQIMSDLKFLQTRLEAYKTSNGQYPTTIDQLGITPMLANPYDKAPYDYRSDGKTYTLSGKLGDSSLYTVTSR